MKPIARKIIKNLFCFGLFCLSGAFMVAAGAWLYLSPQLPSAESYRHVQLETPLRILTADNKLIDEIGIRRDPVRYEEIPPMMIQAVLASEDPRFYSHPGVDIRGLLRGFYGFVRGINLGGGSTITMQLANNISFDSDSVYARKLKEIPFALRIQQELTKEEILTLYLNLIYFGQGADGINAAAYAYYGKPISELGIPEFAMMVSLLPCPSVCNPVYNPERAERRHVAGLITHAGLSAFFVGGEVVDEGPREIPARLQAPERVAHQRGGFLDGGHGQEQFVGGSGLYGLFLVLADPVQHVLVAGLAKTLL